MLRVNKTIDLNIVITICFLKSMGESKGISLYQMERDRNPQLVSYDIVEEHDNGSIVLRSSDTSLEPLVYPSRLVEKIFTSGKPPSLFENAKEKYRVGLREMGFREKEDDVAQTPTKYGARQELKVIELGSLATFPKRYGLE